ncbi:MetQ/NlpA family ABC transporter substrate-binding protein [Brooklawnia cerclae]|uniref:D-methionine transport system substrate-binding protein n=1 Tax=Brooklawnia cerclae TaxID=349934 RepID=A0ABX0SE57_9ACTN|nr:MetQ/NlpA family ABC transporter substrate-binding protein [Brooklawnia cerclae]NIH56649.1 D-methionine transport system substrate-binding protein [Brooklawnia cerclae]
MKLRRLAVLAAAIALSTTLVACSSGSSDSDSSASTTVTIGITDISKDYWTTFKDLAADQGITVELQNFTDYQQPNPILTQGQLDANQFQHLLFLANYNVNADEDLTPIGATVVYQLGLYTAKGYAEPSDIPDGGQIAIPNDATNQARALLVLQSAGLITLNGGGNALSTPADIDESASRVTVVPVDANQTAVQLQSLDGAVINNNFAADANLDPTSAIYSDLEDLTAAEPYINVWAVRKEDVDDATLNKLVEIYHDPSVIGALVEENKGTAVEVDKTPEELQTILTNLEDLIRAQG